MMLLWHAAVVGLLLTVLATADAQKRKAKERTLVEVAKESGLTSFLEWAALDANIMDVLTQPGPVTVFAPTNEAFEQLSPRIIWKMKSNPNEIANILNHHIAPGNFTVTELLAQQNVFTNNGFLQLERVDQRGGPEIQDLEIPGRPSSRVTIRQKTRNALLDEQGIGATNGIIYLVDKVILPLPLQEDPNLEDAMVATGELNIFLELTKKAGLLDALREGAGPTTVFAPTDGAFSGVDVYILRQLNREPRLLKAVILSHIIPSTKITESDMRGTTVYENSLGELIIIRSIANIILVNAATVERTGLVASNGALHVISELLLPSINALGSQGRPSTNNLYERVKKSGLTIYADLLKDASLDLIFQVDGPMTLFAPSNAALSSLPIEEVKTLMEDQFALRMFLVSHAVNGYFTSSTFQPDQIMKNLEDRQLRINVYKKTGSANIYTVNGVPILTSDEQATNGVLHVLDKVLPVTNDDVLEVLRNDGRFRTFLDGIQASDLVGHLRAEGPVTVFAALDSAFNSLPPEEFFSVFLDLPRLTAMMARHIAPKIGGDQTLFSPGLCWVGFNTADGQPVSTAAGPNGSVIIGSRAGRTATIIETDMLAINGVIHVVDNIL